MQAIMSNFHYFQVGIAFRRNVRGTSKTMDQYPLELSLYPVQESCHVKLLSMPSGPYGEVDTAMKRGSSMMS